MSLKLKCSKNRDQAKYIFYSYFIRKRKNGTDFNEKLF